MASPLEDDIFDSLKKTAQASEQAKQDQELVSRLHAQYVNQQQREASILADNNTLPVTISEVRVLHASTTRRTFLERICKPLIKADGDEPITLLEARQEIQRVATSLEKLGIYKSPISAYVDVADPTKPSTSPTDLTVYFSAQERGKYTVKTGTEAGHSEGSAYADVQLRNLFGGAESLNAHASLGTRTKSAYSAFFDSPVLSNPDLRFEAGGLVSSTLKPWASHEERLSGGSTKLRWLSPGGHRHEIGYSGVWRQITGVAKNAAPSVRLDAGDTFKSAIAHTWIAERRDYPLLPSRGYLLKTVSELAGFGPLGGDVGFAKVELESAAAVPVPVPGFGLDSGVSLTAGFRAGMLYPLAIGSASRPQPSRINDRFQLGGPTDVRGFHLSGLGPHEAGDALGGDVYAAGGASLLLPFPRTGKDTPLRLQLFANGGRLLGLRGRKGEEMDSAAVARGMRDTVHRLGDGMPSWAAGVGIVYAHPLARFEVNFSLPVAVRRGEEARKGVSFGVGISFL
ncbi:hypothetical protein EJ06DRAFT_534366 [Trichodelitschia bisporula]|uniref:Bacterial surface antigen (D15) domain-containing protein n=1 Tax=Trichodelitschia bisporula TaxID=703511 RepID=A0A6G1HJJ7_9PEZI|nr:hypothetical protein EJ06DRAFT_534366 [Trichodelitschia bisporula]